MLSSDDCDTESLQQRLLVATIIYFTALLKSAATKKYNKIIMLVQFNQGVVSILMRLISFIALRILKGSLPNNFQGNKTLVIMRVENKRWNASEESRS
jgi:hypothetical protein